MKIIKKVGTSSGIEVSYQDDSGKACIKRFPVGTSDAEIDKVLKPKQKK
jgi:hypothetical protein